MGMSYQTILVAGDLADIRATVLADGRDTAVVPVGEGRWAVLPRGADGYAETEPLAEALSRPAGAVTASFTVFDSDVLVAFLFRDGAAYHEYLSDQAMLEPFWDEDDQEINVDHLGRPYALDEEPPTGAFGADPEMFAPLGVGAVDEAALGRALRGPQSLADHQHHEILHLLNLTPRPLQSTYEAAAQDPAAELLPPPS